MIKNRNNVMRVKAALLGIMSFFCSANLLAKTQLSDINNATRAELNRNSRAPYISRLTVDKDNNVTVQLNNLGYEQPVEVTVFNAQTFSVDTYTFSNRDRIWLGKDNNSFCMKFIALDPKNSSGVFRLLLKFANGTKVWREFSVNPAVL